MHRKTDLNISVAAEFHSDYILSNIVEKMYIQRSEAGYVTEQHYIDFSGMFNK